MTVLIDQSSPQQPASQKDKDLRLRHILKTLPKEVFLQDKRKAWTTVIINVLLVALGYWGLSIAPWYLLPLLWVFTGTALTGFFVIGHDCGHRSFAKRKWVNDLVGHLAFLPLIYPFHGWRVGHNKHHRYTNNMAFDTAWKPLTQAEYANSSPFLQKLYHVIRGRFWWVGSIGHWAVVHFDWRKFETKDQAKVKFSALFVIVAAAIGFPVLIATTGITGFIKFWLMPWLVYHFWMSTFTIVHHTMPDIPFQEAEVWHEALAQLSGTVHCDYPSWVEYLCHDINVHIPHHLSTAIPSYNLRLAHARLKENWGSYLYETKFSWDLMKQITDHCHLYDPEKLYISIPEFEKRQATNNQAA